MKEPGELWQQRYRTEHLMEVACPKCGVPPQEWCDRTAGELTPRGRELLKAGTPPSHQERMWARQGHGEEEFPDLLARQKPGWDETAPQPGKARRRERVTRAAGASPACAPGFPRRYTAGRVCLSCGFAVTVEVAVQDPSTIGYRCRAGHMWLARVTRAGKETAA